MSDWDLKNQYNDLRMATGFVTLSWCLVILSSNRTNMVHDLRTGGYEFFSDRISYWVTALSNISNDQIN
jgi:hypothetical protein